MQKILFSLLSLFMFLVASNIFVLQIAYADVASSTDATSTVAIMPTATSTPVTATSSAPVIAADATTTTVTAASSTPISSPTTPADIEKAVRTAFADVPIMIAIAKCESGFRQFTANGNVLYGGLGNMIGIFQISSGHTAKALSLGFDILTVDGNIGYARYLYNAQSTDPWISSISCWNAGDSSALASVNTSSDALNKNLSFGMVDPQVVTLQQILNRSGFAVATDNGPGSSGNETNLFGNLTRAAVRNFQCVKNIACSGNEYTTGYGLVNGQTRAALLTLSPVASAPPSAGNTASSASAQSSTLIPITSPTLTPAPSPDTPQIASLRLQISQLMAIIIQLQLRLAVLPKT